MIETIVSVGVDDNITFVANETSSWRYWYEINITPHAFGFSGKESYDTCFNRFLELIDYTGATSLIGISGSGSVVLNALAERMEQIRSVVIVCGRLRRGGFSLVPLMWSERKYPTFAQSLKYCQEKF